MKSAFKITAYYALFSSLWIILSDRLISALITDPAALTLMASAKGLFFVTVTSLLLYLMIRRELRIKNKVIVQLDREVELREQLIRELHHRIKNNLQVVLGLMNIETADAEFSQDAKERIANKLISMTSVFNIVYDLRDMNRVSFGSVLEEYRRISFRSIEIGDIDLDASYSIEVIVSCLILIDSLIDAFMVKSDTTATLIASERAGCIDVRFQGPKLGEPAERDRAFLELQAKSIDGSLEIDRAGSVVRICFSRFQ